ncbi:MAG: PH domain-containing protein [Nocardioidaceae bacterium]
MSNPPAAAGPVAPGLPWRYRPLGARLMVTVMGTLLVSVLAFLWVILPASVRDDFTTSQRITLLAVFVVMLAFLYGIGRSAIRADDVGVRIVNVFKVRRLEWAQVVKVRLQPGDPWAVLDVDDGSVVKAMAIQGADGARARRAARELRLLVEEHSRTPRDD